MFRVELWQIVWENSCWNKNANILIYICEWLICRGSPYHVNVLKMGVCFRDKYMMELLPKKKPTRCINFNKTKIGDFMKKAGTILQKWYL